MFRLGSLLFIPAYLSVILYRVFATADDDGNIVVMSGSSFLLSRLYALRTDVPTSALALST